MQNVIHFTLISPLQIFVALRRISQPGWNIEIPSSYSFLVELDELNYNFKLSSHSSNTQSQFLLIPLKPKFCNIMA
jgi:hypothetical protein